MPTGKAKTVCDTMRICLCTYGAPEELLSESQVYNSFLKNWGICKHTSSAHYPQTNGCAELALKTAKHILADNMDNCSHLCHDHGAQALLTHHNSHSGPQHVPGYNAVWSDYQGPLPSPTGQVPNMEAVEGNKGTKRVSNG